MIGYFGRYVQKIKDTKKLASQKNVAIWLIPFIDSLLLSGLSSMLLSIGVWYALSGIEFGSTILENILVNTLGYLPLVFWGVMLCTILPQIITLMIHIHHHFSRLIFAAITRFDMWYWRRYKKDSVLASAILRAQSKVSKLDGKRKNQITAVILVLVAVYCMIRLDLI